MPQGQRDDWWVNYGVYGAVGIQLVAAIAGGMWLGSYLDRRWGTTPWLVAAGVVLGAIGGFFNLWRVLQWKGEDRDEEGG